ncbi:MAG: DUF2723 domain-containing protein [Candidatus Lustribacter sp.]
MSSLPSQVGHGDTAEYQTVPYILGIAHPTGFPAYVLTGWLFSHVLAFGTIAWRMNAYSAICTALTAGGVVLLASALGTGAIAATAAGLTFAFGAAVWHGAAFASAHSLSGLLIVGALLGSVSFARSGQRRVLLAACACAGFGLATQPETIWVLPALVVAALWQRARLPARTVLTALTLVLLPLLLYAYLPIRSEIVAAQHLDPTAAAPLDGAGSLDWDYNHPRTLDGFLNEVLGRNEHAGPLAVRALEPRYALAAIIFWFAHAPEEFSPWFLFLAAAGCIALALRDRRALSVVVAGTAGGLLFAASYREDVELYRYFLVSSAATAALAAAAVRLPLPRVRPEAVAGGVTILLALVAATTWLGNRALAAELRYGGGQPEIDAAARDIPDGAIIVTSWYDAPTLGYGAAIEHALGSRTVVHGIPYQFVDRFPSWARARRVVIFGWGSEINLDAIPPSWLHELPSTLQFYRVFEVNPRQSPSDS